MLKVVDSVEQRMEARSLLMGLGARCRVIHAASRLAMLRSLIVSDAVWPIAKIVLIFRVVCLKSRFLLSNFDLWRLHVLETQIDLRCFLILGRIIRCRLTVANYREWQSVEGLFRRGRRSPLGHVLMLSFWFATFSSNACYLN